MSLNHYKEALEITYKNYEFNSIIQAAMRQADTENQIKLQRCWPWLWEDLQARYNAPGGLLKGDKVIVTIKDGKPSFPQPLKEDLE